MERILVFCVTALFLMCGCCYSLFMNAYPHLKTVQVLPFENLTSEFALAQDFQNYLVNKYQSDGRLKIATISPDSRIEGSVKDYRNEIQNYDISGNITDYRVSILFAITMTDMIQSNTIYDNQSLLMSEVYSPNIPAGFGSERYRTEEEAIERIFEMVFEAIMRATLDSW